MRTYRARISMFNGKYWYSYMRMEAIEVQASSWHVAAYRAIREAVAIAKTRKRTESITMTLERR